MELGDRTPKNYSRSAVASMVWNKVLSSDRSRVYPRHPDEARAEELRKVMSLFMFQLAGGLTGTEIFAVYWHSHAIQHRDTISSQFTCSSFFLRDPLCLGWDRIACNMA